MIELLSVAIGIGLVVSILFGELFGITAGGMIVPGYIALYLKKPFDVVMTLGASFATFALVEGLSLVTIVYGRRRTAITIMIGYLVGATVRWALASQYLPATDMTVIGFIIPGLIAIWFQRQGVIETMTTLLTCAVVVRLILLVIFGAQL